MKKAKVLVFVAIAVLLGFAMTACGEGADDKSPKTEYWNVTWVLNGGEWPAGFTPVANVEKNTSLTKPSDPVNGELPFVGWFSNVGLTTAYNFTRSVTADITLYAKWGGGEYNISVTGGTADKEKAAQGETITLTPDDEEGMVFTGWIIDPPTVSMTSANQFIMPADDVTVTGTFEPKGTGDVPYHITNNLAQDSSTGFLVQWHNAATVDTQTLQVVKATESFDQAEGIEVTGTLFDVTGVTTCPSTNGTCSGAACTGYGNYAARNIFKYAVTGLDPATMYKYRMGEPGSWSEPYYYLTSDASFKEFSFTVVTDTQDNVFEGMTLTLRAANEYDPDHRFFIHAGDVVDFIGLNPSEIVNYTNNATEFIKYKPIATTQGNHDTYHNKTGDQYVFGEATIFNAFTTFPDNGFSKSLANHTAGRSDSYYFYYNEVLVVVLNTMATQNATGTAEPNHTAQAAWLRKVLQDDKDGNLSKFRIVFSHVPPFAGRGNTSDAEPWLMANVRSAYTPICTEFEVDIFFAGHDHVYGRSQPIKITSGANTLAQIATANPGEGNAFGPTEGGVIYSIVGSTGPKTYAFRNTNLATNQFIPRAYSAVLLDQNGTYADALAGGTPVGPSFSPGLFVNVKVTEEKLIVNAVRRDGTILDTYEVRRKDLPPEPRAVNIKAIPGVTAPVRGATAVTTITETAQYTGTVAWAPPLDDGKFAPETTYTATITLSAKPGFLFEGVDSGFFTVAGATNVNNPINSGVVTAVFPETAPAAGTGTPVDIAAIQGITVVRGISATPVTAITETAQYTGTVAWASDIADPVTTFNFGRVYTATITLASKAGFTFDGVEADFFTVAGAQKVTNDADTGVITAQYTIVFTLAEYLAYHDVVTSGSKRFNNGTGDSPSPKPIRWSSSGLNVNNATTGTPDKDNIVDGGIIRWAGTSGNGIGTTHGMNIWVHSFSQGDMSMDIAGSIYRITVEGTAITVPTAGSQIRLSATTTASTNIVTATIAAGEPFTMSGNIPNFTPTAADHCVRLHANNAGGGTADYSINKIEIEYISPR